MTSNAYVQPSGVAVLKANPDDGPMKVRGVALTEDDATHGSSRKRLIWPREVVKEAAESLKGTKIVDDREHELPDDYDIEDLPTEPPVETIVGEVTDSWYEPGLGAVFEGEIDDPKISSLVENGRVEVSPFIFHRQGPFDDDQGGFPVESVAKWRDLAVVANGAGSKASIEAVSDGESGYSAANAPDPGENPRFPADSQPAAMSAAVLSAALDASASAQVDESGDDPEDDPDERPEPSHDDDRDGESANEGVEAASLASFNHLSYDGTATGKLDESKIDGDDFKSHYLFPGETKSDSSFPVVDASGKLRRGNVDSAWSLRGDAPVSKEEIEQVLITLASKFDDPPQTKEDAEALADGESPFDESAESGTDTGSDGGADADEPETEPEESTMGMELTDEEEKSVNRIRALDDPVIVEQDVASMADRADELELGDYDDPHVVEGAEYDEPQAVEKEEYEALSDRVESVENVLAEALAERTGMKEQTAAALGIEELFGEFENDEGEFEAAALVQEPETGDNGEGSDNPNGSSGGEELDEEAEMQAEALAETQMSVADWRAVEAEGLSAREYIKDETGVDPADCDSEQEFRRKVASAEGGD